MVEELRKRLPGFGHVRVQVVQDMGQVLGHRRHGGGLLHQGMCLAFPADIGAVPHEALRVPRVLPTSLLGILDAFVETLAARHLVGLRFAYHIVDPREAPQDVGFFFAFLRLREHLQQGLLAGRIIVSPLKCLVHGLELQGQQGDQKEYLNHNVQSYEIREYVTKFVSNTCDD